MKKRNQKQDKRVKKLILSTGLFAVLLVASTYAWFIGMQSVNVTAFDVKIAAIDGLALSLNGSSFSEEVTINKGNFKTISYEGNQNVWGELIPMSSMGIINPGTSKLELYEKGSLTTTHGGYRLLASLVENTKDKEADGYVAFDLFIKNLSGEEYYSDNNTDNEEAIYLTTDSEVTVANNGTKNETEGDFEGVPGTGIENSVRVGFAQIARVEATTTNTATITGLSCAGGDGVTVICNQRTAQIWEPNDKKHVQNALNWYNTACLARTGKDVTDKDSYGGKCATITDDQYAQTYAIATVIDDKNNTNVDIYDGAAYNGYTQSQTDKFLGEFTYFTDTDKLKRGMDRPAFMTLAPNSITKVRVYVWIEGQDIDNYDFAQLGEAISVKFGFTKERFTDVDVDYKESGTATLPDDVIGDYTKGN